MEDTPEVPQRVQRFIDRFRPLWTDPNSTRFPEVSVWLVCICGVTGAAQSIFNLIDPAAAASFYGVADLLPESLIYRYGVGGLITSSVVILTAFTTYLYKFLDYRVFLFYFWIGMLGSFIFLIVSHLLLVVVGIVGFFLYYDIRSSWLFRFMFPWL